MKRTVVLLLVVLLAFASTSVFAGGEKEAAKGDKLLVGTSVFSTEIEYFKILDDCYKKAAAARGMDIISTDGEDSVDKQIHIIEDLIARGVDGIVISAVNPNAERAILEEAMAAGIPVLLQGQERVEADWPTANVGYSEWDMGYMAGELVAEKINKIAQSIPDLAVEGDPGADLLVLGWGSTYGAITTAVERLNAAGRRVAHAHLRYLHPMPKNTALSSLMYQPNFAAP